MKFFTKSRYALRVMLELASRYSQQKKISLKTISEAQNISLKYLEQIVIPLVRAGLVQSERGSQGGYSLAISPDQCTIGSILRAMEGSLAPVDCLSPSGAACTFRSQCRAVAFWKGLGQCMETYADSVTLKDLMEDAPSFPHGLSSCLPPNLKHHGVSCHE